MFSASWGVPVTMVASFIVTVMLTTSPAFRVLFCTPVAEVMATLATTGGVVSVGAGAGAGAGGGGGGGWTGTLSIKSPVCAPKIRTCRLAPVNSVRPTLSWPLPNVAVTSPWATTATLARVTRSLAWAAALLLAAITTAIWVACPADCVEPTCVALARIMSASVSGLLRFTPPAALATMLASAEVTALAAVARLTLFSQRMMALAWLMMLAIWSTDFCTASAVALSAALALLASTASGS